MKVYFDMKVQKSTNSVYRNNHWIPNGYDVLFFRFILPKMKMMIIGLLCVGMMGCEKARVEDNLGTFNDTKKALIETKKALVLLSITLHKGYESARLLTEYEQTKNKIFNLERDHKKSELEKRK